LRSASTAGRCSRAKRIAIVCGPLFTGITN
jgi:hypothetical protein